MNDLPDDRMKFRISGETRDASYLKVGAKCFVDIEAIAWKAGRPIEEARAVLDFGCGCARILRHWPEIKLPRKYLSKWRRGRPQLVCGTDIDAPSIEYAAQRFPKFSFSVNDPLPPTRYKAGTFDLIYAVSVFSHLREDYALRWIEELRRVSQPGALLIVSVNSIEDRNEGRATIGIPPEYTHYEVSEIWKDEYPDWYGNLYMSRPAARQLFTPHFELTRYIPLGMAGRQDAAVYRAV